MALTTKAGLLLVAVATCALLTSPSLAQTLPPSTLAITPYDISTPLSTLVSAVQAANSGITILSSSYIGITGQGGTYTGFNLPSTTGGQTITAPNGVLLTSGSADLPLTNTSAAFSHETDTGSNAQLTALLGGVATNDQNVLSLTFTVNNPAVNAVKAGFVFGTDEYPEYIEQYNDTIGFFVDGKNYAFFPNGSLVSINSSTSSNFNNNNIQSPAIPPYGIEYDGISNLLSVDGLLDPTLTTHTLTIAIADVIDTAVDSGVFVGGLQAASVSGSGGIVPTTPTIDTTSGDIAPNVFSLGSPAAQATSVEFDGGTLRMTGGSFAGNIITAPVTISASNGTVDTTPASGGFSGVVSGPGSLTIIGSNTFSLTGPNTYAGGTQLQGGTLIVGNDSALGTGTLAMADGTTLKETVGVTLGNTAILSGTTTFETSDTTANGEGLIYNGVISGTGTLVKTGASGLRLTAANTYSGGTVIAAGHIGIANNDALGTGTLTFAGGSLRPHVDGLTISNAAVLASDGTIDTLGHDLTYAGAISGAGQLIKTGQSTLTLTNANAYTGGTALNAGTLAVGNSAALGTGTLTVNAGTVQAGVGGLTIGNAVTLAAAGTVDTQGFGLTMAGVISGPGPLIKTGGGTLAPTGQNTFSGGTVLTAGTVILSNSTTTGGAPSSSSIGTGALTFDGGTLLNGPPDPSGLTLANAIAVNATGGTIDANSANLNIVSSIGNGQGVGTLTFANTGGGTQGIVLLGGSASFSGQATIQKGAFVVLGADNAIGTGNVDVEGVLNLGTSSQAIAQLTGQGTVTDNTGFGPGTSTTNTLAVQSGVFGGTIEENDGLHIALAKTSDGTASGGTLLLSGTNTYTGPTAVDAGTLQAGSTAALSPNSAVTVAGGATLDLGGFTNEVASLAGAGTVTNNGSGTATLTTGRPGASSSFAGVLADGSAPLALAKVGTGTLTLTSPSTYSGGTEVLAGTLEVGNSTALGTGPVGLDDGTELRFVADGLTLANAIALRNTDPTIDTGSGFETIGGPISGPGALTKIGSGTLDLTGTSTYTGATEIAGGTLLVDGTVAASAITVDNGATLGGHGSIASVVVGSGGLLAPSASQALTITGNLQLLTGATYQVTVNADGTDSKLAVGGTADLGGATLSVLAGSGTFKAGRYTLLTAGTLLSGTTFGTVTTATNLALLRPQVIYDYAADDVSLTLNPVAFKSIATTANQAGVAGAIQSLGTGNGLYDAVVGLDAAQARQAFDAASGVTHANTQAVITNFARIGTTLLLDRLWDVSGSGLSAQQVLNQFAPDRMPALVRCYGPTPDPVPVPPPPTYTAWGEAFGTFGHTNSNPNAGALDRSLGGFILGIDTPLDRIGGDKWRAGIAGGYTNTSFKSPLDGGSGTVQNVFGSLYGGARYGAVDVRLGTVAGGTFVDARRDVAFGGAPLFNEIERSNNTGYTVQTFAEVGYRIPAGTVVIEPIAGAAYLHSHQDGFTEKGGVAALTVSAQDTDLGTTTLGFRAEAQPFKDLPIVAHALLGWQHAIGDTSPATTLAFASAPLDTFSVSGTPIDRDALAAEAALDYRVSSLLDVGLTYVGQIGATASDHSVKGRVEYRF